MLTQITNENIRYFHGLLGPYWDTRSASDIILGYVDPDGEAVGACVLFGDGLDLNIRFIAVTPSRRREGIGRDFLSDIIFFVYGQGVKKLTAVYLGNGPEADGWTEFFKDSGFNVSTTGIVRYFYDIGEVESCLKESKDLPEDLEIRRRTTLLPEDVSALYELEAEEDGLGGTLDPETVLSSENRYGGVFMREGRIAAAVSAMPFGESVRLDTLFIPGDDGTYTGAFLKYVLSQTEKEKNPPKKLCFETDEGSDKPSELVAFFSKQDLSPKISEKIYRANIRLDIWDSVQAQIKAEGLA